MSNESNMKRTGKQRAQISAGPSRDDGTGMSRNVGSDDAPESGESGERQDDSGDQLDDGEDQIRSNEDPLTSDRH